MADLDLFAHASQKLGAPLAELIRPADLDDLVGQEQLIGPGTLLRQAIDADRLPSLILWGPPGTGKTTLARIVARRTGARFVAFSAVLGGVKEIREIVQRAKEDRQLYGRRTLLFVDEIHRFNKSQQDAFLPHLEDGTLVLIGATTENPSFELNAALLSRCRVFVLRPLDRAALTTLVRRALAHPALAARGPLPELTSAACDLLVLAAHGDARQALGSLEAALDHAREVGASTIDERLVAEASQRKVLRYDRAGDEHYALVSAFIKSMRGSDPDAAVYYLVRMLEAGEEGRFLCRRMVIFASEDVGLADPRALQVAVAASQAFELVGLPEAVLPLSEAAIYLALAPKSNTVIRAYTAARKEVRSSLALPVPAKLRNPVTALDRAQGHGASYRYPHDLEGNYSPEHYLPRALRGRRFVELGDSGEEGELRRRLSAWEELREAATAGEPAAGTPPQGVAAAPAGGVGEGE